MLFGEDASKSRLRRMVVEARVEDRVRFLGFRDDVPQSMASSDITVHTSIAPEAFGRFVVEGLPTKKPVIAANAGGAPEIIEHGVPGLLVAPADPRAFAAAIVELLGAPGRVAEMARRRRESALYRFSLRSTLQSIDETIASVSEYCEKASFVRH